MQSKLVFAVEQKYRQYWMQREGFEEGTNGIDHAANYKKYLKFTRPSQETTDMTSVGDLAS